MSVVIRGMKMPKSCDDCRFRDDAWCLALPRSEWRKAYNKAPEGERLEDCPLIELPPHGRLIDVDELVADIKGQAERMWTLDAVSERDYFIERNEKFRQAMFKSWCESMFAYLDTRPTVIEAEGVQNV